MFFAIPAKPPTCFRSDIASLLVGVRPLFCVEFEKEKHMMHIIVRSFIYRRIDPVCTFWFPLSNKYLNIKWCTPRTDYLLRFPAINGMLFFPWSRTGEQVIVGYRFRRTQTEEANNVFGALANDNFLFQFSLFVRVYFIERRNLIVLPLSLSLLLSVPTP